jgi:hypothetical protein
MLDVVITLAVLVYILYRQRQVRPAAGTFLLPIILLILGFIGLSAGKGRLTSDDGAILVALLVGDAVGLGVLRAWTVRLWRQDGTILRQGTWLTVGLWLVGFAIHEVVDVFVHLPVASLLLYLGVTLAAQQLMVQARVRRLEQRPAGGAWSSLADGQGPGASNQNPAAGKPRQ